MAGSNDTSLAQPPAAATHEPSPCAEARIAPGGSGWLALWRHKERLLLVIDALIVYGTYMLVYYGRFHVWSPGGQAPTELYWQSGALLAAVWVLLIRHYGGYESGLRGIAAPILRVRTVVLSGIYATCVLMVVSFLYGERAGQQGQVTPPPMLSRLTVLMALVMAALLLIVVRLMLRRTDRMLADRGVVCSRVVVAGSDAQARDFCIRLRAFGSTTRVVAFLRGAGEGGGDRSVLGCAVLGGVGDLPEVHRARPFDFLVLSDKQWDSPSLDQEQRLELLNWCESSRVKLYVLPSSYDVAVTRREIASVSNVPLIRLEDASTHRAYLVIKRLTDVVASAVVLVALLPLWALVALAIKLDSRGPVLYSQRRVGLFGRPFNMLKFRSMVQDADQRLSEVVDLDNLKEPVFNVRRDPRVTRVGALLRRLSLDEMPQLVNVLAGQMSIVGPRPERQEMVDRYNSHQRRRLKAKPGITGLQQVVCRGDPSLARRITYDLLYMKYQGLLLDAYIVLRTFVVVLKGSGLRQR
jgi:exopolysaccharide biosynthesis polyprenyl glycosylphosphotransferase